MSLAKDIYHLFFPPLCASCGSLLVGSEHNLCTKCFLSLPLMHNAGIENNVIEKRFLSLVPCQSAMSFLDFKQGNTTQKVIHQIKYHGNISLAHTMGRLMGQELLDSGRFGSCDLLLPVPLHWRKQLSRGYNQSEEICRGIVQKLPIPISKGDVIRSRYTKTQTRKKSGERLDNMDQVFEIRHKKALVGHHILVVDDVLTTGATLLSVCKLLADLPNTRISIATLAMATPS